MAQAATEDFLGLPLEALQRVTVVVEPPMGAAPQYAAILSSSERIAFEEFRSELTEHTVATTLLDRPLLESQRDPAPSLCLLDDYTLAVGPKLFLKRLLRGTKSEGSELARLMSEGDAASQHLHGVVSLKPLRPLIELGIIGAKGEAPPETHKFLDGLLLLDRVVLSADLSGERASSLVVYADDKAAADRVEGLLVEGMTLVRERGLNGEDMEKVRNHPEATVRAWGAYLDRAFDERTELAKTLREGDDAFVLGRLEAGDPTQPMAMVAVTGILIALILPAVQAAREAARRNTSMNNLKQIALALHNYHDVNNHFPPHAIYSADGKPLLSWRVAILPYLEQQELYEKFHLDEPWDSPHNKALLAEVPEVFIDPSSGRAAGEGRADYLAVVGPTAAFTGGPTGRNFGAFTDGTARTVMLVQVNDEKGVEWTKPADYDAVANDANPIGGIKSMHPGAFLGGFADGHVQALPMDTAPETLRALMTVNGGEPVELP